jgi:hypothetical protein
LPSGTLWRKDSESSGDEDDGNTSGNKFQLRMDCLGAQTGVSLDHVIRQVLCVACDKKFCTGCASNQPSRSKAVKSIEIVKFVKNFKMIPRSASLVDISSTSMSFKAPFLVPKGWPGSIIASALNASNEIPGDISCQNKPQKVSFLGSLPAGQRLLLYTACS